MSKNEIKLKGVVEKETAISHLEDILETMKQGRINIQSSKDTVTITPGPFMAMEIKAKSGKGKEKIEIELSWRSDKEIKGEPFEITITSDGDEDEPRSSAHSEHPLPARPELKTPATSAPSIELQDKSEKETGPDKS
ncbi:amphi-Trp domain-containing protein [Desulfonatronovibrio hydrogenovorans]|uniref:amphi-Trp domain-containing protein n=1 Tax=Desulfonatronovibrio hydrogenovorans TaxID=53245 RepID=UPI00048FFB04|nr:amphi-Trp domain-containing protein [Desulfonatronovibrio hydrogenovorans]